MQKMIAGLIISATLATGAAWSALPARAQNGAAMSCDELWYARNEIYARRGYCFKTARARATFGPGCFEPYGHLSGWEVDRVNELQMWESRKGCP